MNTSYHDDVLAWAGEQAKMLREHQLSGLDFEHLADEIEAMSASQRREHKNRLTVLLLQHLLKWDFQPDHSSRSWKATLLEQRTAIQELLAESPSLRTQLETTLASAYPSAVRLAATETGLDMQTFPSVCPYTQGEAIAEDWLPADHT
ncbi:MAG: DUF29 domain-containing protein [Rhodoferax sp.]|nr:DUF29 domain-containing protein [Rhodoferax sp.]